ncbi:MAG: 50S ribosomal protein P1 [Candidatus Hadarchaeota archaeon]
MEYVHAAILLHSVKQPVNEENVKKVLAASGAQVDEARVKALVAALEGVNIDEAIKGAAIPVAAAPAAAAAAPAKPEEKKEEKKVEEEKKEEEALAGLGALFG